MFENSNVSAQPPDAHCPGCSTGLPTAVEPGDTLVLIPTSGSTNAPKLVAHRHSSLVLASEGFPAWLGLDETDRLFTPLPLFHGNALIYSLLGSLGAAASLILLPRFSARRFWDRTREFAVTQFNLIGTMGAGSCSVTRAATTTTAPRTSRTSSCSASRR
jgi:acyl-CoA synthetase (AMP-forming)/AMP-acid ligase II